MTLAASSTSEMTRSVLLLRAVNVGGSGRLPMKTLTSSLSTLGITSITTYLQSGNAVCSIPFYLTMTTIANAIPVPNGTTVIQRTKEDITAVLLQIAKWGLEDPTKVAVVFLDEEPEEEAMNTLLTSKTLKRGDDTVRKFGGKDLVLEYPNGGGRAALTLKAIEKVLGVKGTGRNLRTVKALQQMLGD